MNRRSTPIVSAVVWDDAHQQGGEVAAHEIDHQPYRFTTIGIIIRSDEMGVSIAPEVGDDNRFRDVNFIPRSLVRDEFEIGPLRKKAKRSAKSSSVSASADQQSDNDKQAVAKQYQT